jgi:hypothetical protein
VHGSRVACPVSPQAFPRICDWGHLLDPLETSKAKVLSISLWHRVRKWSSSNAVEWDVNGNTEQGVYIPRRDTSSRLNSFAGGRIFPGVHHRAKFNVVETETRFTVSMLSEEGNSNVHVNATVADRLPSDSIFQNTKTASSFFEHGSLGYSETGTPGKYDGLELRCQNWSVKALDVHKVTSGYFEDVSRFPKGSVEFDCALLMRDIDHEWHGRADLCSSSA